MIQRQPAAAIFVHQREGRTAHVVGGDTKARRRDRARTRSCPRRDSPTTAARRPGCSARARSRPTAAVSSSECVRSSGSDDRTVRLGDPRAAATSPPDVDSEFVAMAATASQAVNARRRDDARMSLAVIETCAFVASARSPAMPCRNTASRHAASASSSCASQARNHAGEHVAGAAGRHAGIAGRVDEHAPVRRGDQRAMALQHDVDVMRRREIAGDVDAVGLHFVDRRRRSAGPSRPDAA